MKLECKQCGGKMVKTKISKGNCLGLFLALIQLFLGLFLLFLFPIGTIFGVLLLGSGSFTGGKVRKVWKCKKCKCILERA